MDLRKGSEIVEKDSPPTSFVSPPGPSSLNMQQMNAPPTSQRQPYGQVVSGGPSGTGRGLMKYGDGGQLLPLHTGGRGVMAQTGSRMRLGHGSNSRVGPGQRSTANYPIQEVVTPNSSSSGHALSTNPQMALPNTSVTSLSNLSGNQLEVGIDRDIVVAADDVKNQAHGEGGTEDAPLDPNLECPTCGRGFRIGQIQLFRQHAASCNNKK